MLKVTKLGNWGGMTQPASYDSTAGPLTPLETALAALLDNLAPVPTRSVPVGEAAGFVAAEMSPIETPVPPTNIAEIDGWAFRAGDLVGASPYAPLAITGAPEWVEVGAPLPSGCDCVLEPGFVERAGTAIAVLAEAAPGEGARRAGDDAAVGRPVVNPGRVVTELDLMLVRSAGLDRITVRRPEVRIIDVASATTPGVTAQLVAEILRTNGARLECIEFCAKNVPSIIGALKGRAADLFVLVGGTGEGRTDATAAGIAEGATLIAHRIALLPGTTAAIGRAGGVPMIALPGTPAPAFGAWLALGQPALDRLSGRVPRRHLTLPLARKISSAIGLAEIVLVRQERDCWMPLAVGDLALDHMREADAWLAVPASGEGYASGTPVAAALLHGWS